MQNLKVLVANRGEISVRVVRAAHELSMITLAIYSEEDRLAGHRQKADEAYLIGNPGEFGPVEAYLQGDGIVCLAKEKNVDLIHPGYGFLSENATFAAMVRAAGMIFVGPPTDVIQKMGDKVTARQIARTCNIPTIPGTDGPLQSIQDGYDFIQNYGYPVVVKACFGGGGRGMRVVREGDSLEDAVEAASSEASAAFGKGSVFLEKFLHRPKHIEVQILGDKYGNIVHLYERDCSIQRKYQKVVEIAPSHNLASNTLEAIFNAAIKLARFVKYENAGTVEFLLENDHFYFIEMNPRIQVEHTVTEELTGVDIVNAQLRLALGESLSELNLTQENISQRGCSIQCRITTEAPSKLFRPDSGKLDVCRLPTGPGIRLDSSDIFQGASISSCYDPLLVKCTCSGLDMAAARQKALRALKEVRIRGVETNVSFLIRVLESPSFATGSCWTTFIDDSPELLVPSPSKDRPQKFLRFLGDAAINGSRIQGQVKPPALIHDISIRPLFNIKTGQAFNTDTPCSEGWREVLLTHGPEGFAKMVRAHKSTLITDTTWRDGQQSLLATRVRTRDLVAIATSTSYAYSAAYSLESWGGATFDVALRFLYEDPWERLRELRKLVPNIPFQMLLRSTNGVAYSALPDNAIYHFVKLAKETGVDIFRVFDCLNNLDNLEIGISAVHAAGGVVEGAIMYTGDMLKPGKYNLKYYMGIVDRLVELSSHVIAIKSMSGVMKPSAGRALVRAIRAKYPSVPIHVHTHDTNGTGVATMLACVEEGADIVDTAIDSLSGSTSQPAVSAVLGVLENTDFEAEPYLKHIEAIDAYWAQLRLMYAGFDADLRSPDPNIYKHEIPGGQYSNMMFQARQLGLGSQWQETQRAYAEANHLLGDIIKATPTSKAVGDLAQFMVDRKLTSAEVTQQAATLDLPSSVLDYFQGLMGQPFDGFPEPFRTDALRGRRDKLSCRAGLNLAPINFDSVRQQIVDHFPDLRPTEHDVATYVMYPEVFVEFHKARAEFGDLTNLRTPIFLTAVEIGQQVSLIIEQGKELVAEMISIGPLDPATAKREVLFRLNGEIRSIYIHDNKAVSKRSRSKANPHDVGHVAAPMSGRIVRVLVQDEAHVRSGDVLLAMTAMKMDLNVSANKSGRIEGLAVRPGDAVEKDDLLLRIVPSGAVQLLEQDR